MAVFIKLTNRRKQIENKIPQRSYKIADILLLIQIRFNQLKLPLDISLSDKNRVSIKLKKLGAEQKTALHLNEYLSKS